MCVHVRSRVHVHTKNAHGQVFKDAEKCHVVSVLHVQRGIVVSLCMLPLVLTMLGLYIHSKLDPP